MSNDKEPSASPGDAPAGSGTDRPQARQGHEGMPDDSQRRIIQLQFDIEYTGSAGKEMDPTSLTLPDLNMSVRQLIKDFTRGSGTPAKEKTPLYLQFPVPVLQDITDVENYLEVVETQAKNIREFIDQEEAKKKVEEEEINKREALRQQQLDEVLANNKRKLKPGDQLTIDDHEE